MKYYEFTSEPDWASTMSFSIIYNSDGSFSYGDVQYIHSGGSYYYPTLMSPLMYDRYWLERFRSIEVCKSDMTLFDCFVKHCNGEVHTYNPNTPNSMGYIISHKTVKLLSRMA